MKRTSKTSAIGRRKDKKKERKGWQKNQKIITMSRALKFKTIHKRMDISPFIAQIIFSIV